MLNPKDGEEYMTKHVVSALSYFKDRKEFRNMIKFGDDTVDDFDDCIKSIHSNGITVYGCMIATTREDINKLSDIDDICYMATHKIW